MTIPEEVRKITDPIDEVLGKIQSELTRIEAQKVAREQGGLLAEVAARIEADPAFRAAIIMLAVD
jgi:hypothetical protein